MDEEVVQYVALEAALPHEGMDVKARLAAEEYRVLAPRQRARPATRSSSTCSSAATRARRSRSARGAGGVARGGGPRGRAPARRWSGGPSWSRRGCRWSWPTPTAALKKAELIPEVSLAVTYDSFFNVDLLPRNLAQVGLQLKWEPFDWGRRRQGAGLEDAGRGPGALRRPRRSATGCWSRWTAPSASVQEARAAGGGAAPGPRERPGAGAGGDAPAGAQQAVAAEGRPRGAGRRWPARARSTTRRSFRCGRPGPSWRRPLARTVDDDEHEALARSWA